MRGGTEIPPDQIGRALRPGAHFARKTYRKAFGAANLFSEDAVAVTRQAASDLIKARLATSEPLMIARLGAVELTCVVNYLGIYGDRSAFGRLLAFISGRGGPLWWEEESANAMRIAGLDLSLLKRFCIQQLEDMKIVDVLGSWLSSERIVSRYLEQAVRVKLRDLEPYYHADPWTEVLRDKKVLVIHPFSESVAAQYARRAFLFDDPRVLPNFDLRTLKAVWLMDENEKRFRDWFHAYEYMRDEMSKIDFDVALIGASAYGFPLAAHAKRMGKKSVHLGGAVQILFGIKGKRWDNHPVISKLYNAHWVRPLPNERPANYLSVEDGCYW